MQARNNRKVLVTGATGFLGYRVVMALLELGADVTVLARPDRTELLSSLQNRITILNADVWNKASLKGRARGQGVILHLVGSPHADSSRGLTHHQLNLVPARHVIGMAISDGVPNIVLLSSAARPFDVSGEYIRSKRESEEYLQNSGVEWTIVRAPDVFLPKQSFSLRFISLIGRIFPLNLLFGNILPLPVDIAARGIASLALTPQAFQNRIIYARQLRKLARSQQNQRPLMGPVFNKSNDNDTINEPPFGWMPPH